MRRYRTADEDSARWAGFDFRAGDIVISTRSKHGTTWVQTICALLVHGPHLPAPLPLLSPWVDWLGEQQDTMFARLAAQPHRRILKTHTPLDGVPRVPGVQYVVAARHPLDAAVSLWHQGANLDRERMAQLTGVPAPDRPREQVDLTEWLRGWIGAATEGRDPRTDLDSVPGVLHHLGDAWSRRNDPDVLLVHYHDLTTDLAGQVERLAGWLGIALAPDQASALAKAASFEQMRAQADQFAPDHGAIFRDRSAFFRRGTSGAAGEVLAAGDVVRYARRAAALAPADLLAWLHRPSRP